LVSLSLVNPNVETSLVMQIEVLRELAAWGCGRRCVRFCDGGTRWPVWIVLSVEERRELECRARAYSGTYWRVMRAKIVLLAAEGSTNVEIAARLDTPAGGVALAEAVL
jgi:hypothetical protein